MRDEVSRSVVTSCDAIRERSVMLLCVLRNVMLTYAVLIAEDERRLADAIARGLRREGMAVDLAGDGSDALVKSRVVRYDVLVLDRDLPGVHGDDVCRAVRGERPETGIIMLTAAGELEDLVEGLSLGRRRLSRQAVSLRRAGRADPRARRAARRPSRPPVLEHGDLELDPGAPQRRRARASRSIWRARSSRCSRR